MNRIYKLWLLPVLFVLLGGVGDAQTLETPWDVRGASWGMSREEVLAIEQCLLQDSAEDWLLYVDILLGAPTFITYTFVDGKLFKILITLYPETEKQAQGLVLSLSSKLNSCYSCKYPELNEQSMQHGGVYINDRTQVVLLNDYKTGKVVSVSYIALNSDHPPSGLQAEWVRISDDLERF